MEEDSSSSGSLLFDMLDMPEYALQQRMMIFGDSLYIFQTNFDHLEKLVV